MILKILLTFVVTMIPSWIYLRETSMFSDLFDDICEWTLKISFIGTVITALIYIWISL